MKSLSIPHTVCIIVVVELAHAWYQQLIFIHICRPYGFKYYFQLHV